MVLTCYINILNYFRKKYEKYGVLRTLAHMTFDGFVRFGALTVGVWTDGVMKSYSVTQRAEKYSKHYINLII